jgi:hypothetical protein
MSYETIKQKDGVVFEKNKNTSEYRIVSSLNLKKKTNILEITKNNEFFKLIAALNQKSAADAASCHAQTDHGPPSLAPDIGCFPLRIALLAGCALS